MTLRLLYLAADNWVVFDGRLASRGIDPWDLIPSRFFSLIYHWATEPIADEADLRKFEGRLWRPPPGVAAAAGSVWAPEQENAALSSLKGSLTSTPASTAASRAASGGPGR